MSSTPTTDIRVRGSPLSPSRAGRRTSEAPAPAHLSQLGDGHRVVVLERFPYLREPPPQAVLELLALVEAVADLDAYMSQSKASKASARAAPEQWRQSGAEQCRRRCVSPAARPRPGLGLGQSTARAARSGHIVAAPGLLYFGHGVVPEGVSTPATLFPAGCNRI